MEGKSVDELIAEYKKMVTTGKLIAPLAAENLDHWLGNTGSDRKIPATSFQTESSVVSHLRQKHRAVFLSKFDKAKGIVPRIRKNPAAAKYSMEWEDSMYAQPLTNLYFALGGFTLRSKVEVEVTPDPKVSKTFNVKILSWQSQAFDDYNWDHGKSVYIPGWGKIDDKEALRVEKAGKAKSYIIESDWWRVTQPTIVGPAQVVVY